MDRMMTLTAMTAMDIMTNELYHHGVKGMKWGVRRTKAQLGYQEKPKKKKVSASSTKKTNRKKLKERQKLAAQKEAVQKRRQRILSSPTQLYKHRNEFTKQEIDDAIKRFDTDKRLRDLSANEMSRGKQYLDTLIGYGQSGIKAYDTVAKVHNAFSKGKDLPLIEGKQKKKKDEDDN